MRRAAAQASRSGISRGRRAITLPFPAPSGGLDTDSPMSAMPAENAVQLDNFFPTPAGVELRRGFWLHAQTAETGPVETLLPYHSIAEAGDRIFAACGDKIFDVTSRLAAPVAVVTGLLGARWQAVNYATSGGQFLWACNGIDSPRVYNGAAWSIPNITGFDPPSSIVTVSLHKKRLWLGKVNSLDAAYLPVDSFQGAATVFPLSGVFSKGGYLVAIGSWATDAGEGGDDDLLVFVSSRGQIAVYSGNDPSQATTFGLVGVWDFAPPIGRRCLLRIGNDLSLITQDGIVPLSAVVRSDRASAASIALNQRIRNVVSQAARSYARNFGWQLVSHPRGNMVFLNVPMAEGVEAAQFVMSTITGRWCRFTGQNGGCWASFGDRLLFGGAGGAVYEADVAHADYGRPIVAVLRTAFSPLGALAVEKIVSMLRPTITTDGELAPAVGIDTDFRQTDATTSSGGRAAANAAVWDVSNWDEANWSEAVETQNEWVGVSGIGEMVSIQLRLTIEAGAGLEYSAPPIFQVNGFTIAFETGQQI